MKRHNRQNIHISACANFLEYNMCGLTGLSRRIQYVWTYRSLSLMMQFFPPSLALTLIRMLPYVWKFIRCMFSGVRHWVGVWRWTSPTLFTSAGERERERGGGGGGTTAKGRERGQIIASQRHFPNFYTKQAFKTWRSPPHAVFHWNVQGKTRKRRKNTASLTASLDTGVQPRLTVQLFMPVSDVVKRSSSQFFSRLWVSFGEQKP